MMKIVVLVVIVSTVYSEFWHGEIPDVPGVSAASMDKLRQMMTPRPTTKEGFMQVIQQWMNGLSPTEKEAAEEFGEQMRQKHHTMQPGASG
ncbi:hypothetical protein RB195_012993 [Necator americanus]|uniref:Uncharacterized protein n=2 Tax=Necator americanus TaxID=51031 RepID=A0ABR1DTG4_NECAM|nr:hypothetical protein NECAME_02986 [Necator americanus]ETN78027.1 hypothetical protein NECAME_02986 [Necator americanus]